MSELVTRAEHPSFGGRQGFYERASAACAGPMRFSVFLPPKALAGERVPAVYYLAGLTCSDEHLPTKGGAQAIAAELGLALVSCDTSPRTQRYPGDDASWDFGVGAGFYLDASEAPYSASYRMESHVTAELLSWVEEAFPITSRRGIFGHSMGGHGALSLALRHPDSFASASAFAPIVAPSRVPWGEKAFAGYLGSDRGRWAEHDTCELVRSRPRKDVTLLVDQGLGDKFLERELKPELLEAACKESGQPLTLRRQAGYDHSYYFIATFMGDHLRHHASVLCG